MNLNGILNVCKEQGYTSHDVVAKLRGICHQKKIGHTGTLDPMATGVLPVCFGNATKLCDFLTDQNKTYRTVMLLGKTSDTYDTTGIMLTERGSKAVDDLNEEEIRAAILSFVPGYEQIPPMYSAKKVDGKKLYELARKGIEVERKAVPVKIPSITIDAVELPRVTFTVTCSKGTYIRSLVHDIGQKLGCGAVMEELVRTKASGFAIEDALTLSEIEKMAHSGTESAVRSGTGSEVDSGEALLASHMVATDAALTMYPAVSAQPEADKLLLNGNMFDASLVDITQPNTQDTPGIDCEDTIEVDITKMPSGQICRVYRDNGAFVGLYRYEKEHRMFKPYKMFL